ncbi:BRO1 domain-containing protein [Scleroderma yunnanense]
MFLFNLPTTAAVSFADLCVADRTAQSIADTTHARATLRAVLKHARRTDDQHKDYLSIIKAIDDYLPHLHGIISCVEAGSISLRVQPVFNWRTTLSSHLLNNAPRVPLPSLHADLAFSLLVYGMALSNFARLSVATLGNYEHEPAISDIERRAKDDKLNFAVSLLCRASGVFSYISDSVLTVWNQTLRPPDMSTEVCAALSKMALADAQSLAIRKLLSRSAYESTLSPGPPLPKSHPSTALLAKLHLECASLYSFALTLAMTPEKVRSSPNASADIGGTSGQVIGDLKRHLSDEAAFHAALAHKWLGVDAGDSGIVAKAGDAVGYLAWAKRELEDLAGGFKGPRLRKEKPGAQGGKGIKGKATRELDTVALFLTHYTKMNDSLTFQPIPKQSDLQAMVPAGRPAVAPKVYTLPTPAFGPTLSPAEHSYSRRDTDDHARDTGSDSEEEVTRSYAAAGSYF